MDTSPLLREIAHLKEKEETEIQRKTKTEIERTMIEVRIGEREEERERERIVMREEKLPQEDSFSFSGTHSIHTPTPDHRQSLSFPTSTNLKGSRKKKYFSPYFSFHYFYI